MRCVFERFGTCDRQRIAPRLDHDLIARRSLEVHHAAPVKERYGTGQHTAHTQRRTGRHLASLNEWILTTTAGFERTALEVSKPGVRQSSRTRFPGALGRPGGFGSSAMPKTHQQSFDLQTQAPSGRPCWARSSAGMYLYCDGRLGSAAQASAFLPKQGGPAGMATCQSASPPANQPRDLGALTNGRRGKAIRVDCQWISMDIHGYSCISMDIRGSGYP